MKPFPSQTQLPEYGAAAFIFVGRRLSKILQLQKYNTPPNPMNSHRVRSTAHGVLRPYTDRPLCLQTRKDLKFDATYFLSSQRTRGVCKPRATCG